MKPYTYIQGDDWVALYKYGELVYQGHSLPTPHILSYLGHEYDSFEDEEFFGKFFEELQQAPLKITYTGKPPGKLPKKLYYIHIEPGGKPLDYRQKGGGKYTDYNFALAHAQSLTRQGVRCKLYVTEAEWSEVNLEENSGVSTP